MTATSYTFPTARTDLGLEPGWTLNYGISTALYPTGSGTLNRQAVATGDNFYSEGSSVSGTQKAGMFFGTVVGSTAPRMVVLGSGSVGAFNGYELYPVSTGTMRVVRTIAGTGTNIIGTIGVAATNALFFLEVVVNAGVNCVVNVYDSTGTGTPLATFPDTNASRPVSGFNGIRGVSTAASTVNVGQAFYGNQQDAGVGGSVGGLLLMGCGS